MCIWRAGIDRRRPPTAREYSPLFSNDDLNRVPLVLPRILRDFSIDDPNTNRGFRSPLENSGDSRCRRSDFQPRTCTDRVGLTQFSPPAFIHPCQSVSSAVNRFGGRRLRRFAETNRSRSRGQYQQLFLATRAGGLHSSDWNVRRLCYDDRRSKRLAFLRDEQFGRSLRWRFRWRGRK